jgi:hypothetical protein
MGADSKNPAEPTTSEARGVRRDELVFLLRICRLGFQIRGRFRSGEARAELDPGTSAEIPKICGFTFR